MIGQAAGFAGSYGGYYNYRYTNRQINEALSDNAASKADDKVKQTKSSTVMSDYYRENPDKRAEQESRVNEGRKLLKEAGLYPEDINNLSMDCFKDSVSRLISNIPYSSTRPFDEETLTFNEKRQGDRASGYFISSLMYVLNEIVVDVFTYLLKHDLPPLILPSCETLPLSSAAFPLRKTLLWPFLPAY